MNTMNSCIKKEVALIGANTKFGKITSFLLKQSPWLNKLILYDDKTLKPLEDIKYINTPCQVSFVNGREHMNEAIKTADIIILGDDDPKGMSNEAALISRAPTFTNYVQQIADHNSNAIIVVATSPVNMTVPLAAEVLRNHRKLDERKLIGMTNVQNVKARSILAHHLQILPGSIDFPVIGGLTPETSVPLLSNRQPLIPLNEANLQKITCAVKTSATKLDATEGSQDGLNRAYATANLVKSIVAGLNGYPSVETVLSYQKIINNTEYFSLPVLLGEHGIMEHIKLPTISHREKYLLSHAVTCMEADSKIAKKCYSKLSMNIVKPASAPQNKFNQLKHLITQKKRPQSQYSSRHNTYQTLPIAISCFDGKLKPTMDNIYLTNYSCNENIKKIENASSSLELQKSVRKSKIFCETVLTGGRYSLELQNQTEKQSEPIKSEVYPFMDSENLDDGIILNQVEIKPEIETKIKDLQCTEATNTKSKKLECNAILPQKSTNIKGNTFDSYYNFVLLNNHSVVKRSLSKPNKIPASEIGKTLDEQNAIFDIKTQNLTDLKKNKSVEKIISSVGEGNFISTISLSPQLDNETKMCNEGEYKYVNNTLKHFDVLEGKNTDNNKKKLITENLENIFTSNIVRMVNEMESRKGRQIGASAIKDQSENTFGVELVSSISSPSRDNDDNFDLFDNKPALNDKNIIINKIDNDSTTDTSFIFSSDTKASGKKYSLGTNQPHWILHSVLFKSEKYNSAKLPILSRYAFSESHNNRVKKKTFTDGHFEKEMHTTINKSQERTRLQSLSSKPPNNAMNNTGFIYSNLENHLKKKQKKIKSPTDTFFSRYSSSERNYNKISENKNFMGINFENEIKQEAYIPKFKTYPNKKREFLRYHEESPGNEAKKLQNEEIKQRGDEAFDSEETLRQVKSISKSQTTINKSYESKTITSELLSNDRPLTAPKFKLPKDFDEQRKLFLNPLETNDTNIYKKFIEKQKDSISFGHKIASFNTERSNNPSFSIQQRKKSDFEILEKAANHRNIHKAFQKLHLLRNNRRELSGKEQWKHTIEKSKIPISKPRSEEIKNKNLTLRDEGREKAECIATSGNNSLKEKNGNNINAFQKQVTNAPANHTKKDRGELVSEKVMSNITYHDESDVNANMTSESNGDSRASSKNIKQRPNSDPETKSIINGEIKEESENKAV